MRHSHPSRSVTIGYCTTAKLNKNEMMNPTGKLSAVSKIAGGYPEEEEDV